MNPFEQTNDGASPDLSERISENQLRYCDRYGDGNDGRRLNGRLATEYHEIGKESRGHAHGGNEKYGRERLGSSLAVTFLTSGKKCTGAGTK